MNFGYPTCLASGFSKSKAPDAHMFDILAGRNNFLLRPNVFLHYGGFSFIVNLNLGGKNNGLRLVNFAKLWISIVMKRFCLAGKYFGGKTIN